MSRPAAASDNPAYMVVIAEHVVFDRLQTYRKALDQADLYRRFGGRFVVARRPATILEGEYPDDRLTLVVEFPDRAAAHGWWYSADYQRIKPLRADGGAMKIAVWDKLPPPAAAAPFQAGTPVGIMVVTAENLVGDGYRNYLRALRDEGLLDRAGGVPLLGGPPAEIFEGEFPRDRNTVAIRFPSVAAIDAFWTSPEYARIKRLRAGAGKLTGAVWQRSA